MKESPKILIRDRLTGRKRVAFTCSDESRTQQQFKTECDVNTIMAKYKKTGMINHFNKHQGFYGDFADGVDYRENLERLSRAQESFDDLPATVRKRFDNDPSKLLEFLSRKENKEEAITLGLIPKPVVAPDSMEVAMTKALEANDKKRSARSKSET